jgi:hypothetical protein
MDRQARKMAALREEGGSDVGSELGSNTDSDSEDKVGGVSCVSVWLWQCNVFAYRLSSIYFQ